MGHLRYGIPVSVGNRELGCGASSFSGLSPTLSAVRASGSNPYNQLFPLQDSAADATPSVGNKLKVTFDIGGCLRANGIDPTGQQVRLPLEAVTESRPGGTDRTAQTIAVCLPGCTPPPTGGGPTGGGPTTGPPASGDKADLAIDSVVLSEAGGDCLVTAQVANRGTAMAPPTDTRVVATGLETVIATQNIAAGGTHDRERHVPRRLRGPDVHARRRQRQQRRRVLRDQQLLVRDDLSAGRAGTRGRRARRSGR